MAKTQNFKELVRHEVAIDPAFAEALSRELEDLVFAGDIETAKIVRWDYLGGPRLAVTKGNPPV